MTAAGRPPGWRGAGGAGPAGLDYGGLSVPEKGKMMLRLRHERRPWRRGTTYASIAADGLFAVSTSLRDDLGGKSAGIFLHFSDKPEASLDLEPVRCCFLRTGKCWGDASFLASDEIDQARAQGGDPAIFDVLDRWYGSHEDRRR